MILISLFLWCLAAVCSAGMDVLQFHYYGSVFYKRALKENSSNVNIFWNPELSWLNKYNFRSVEKGFVKWSFLGFKFNKPVCLTDGWHLFKTLGIFCLCGAVVCSWYSHYRMGLFECILTYIFFGIMWNVVFNLFYNKIFVVK